MYDEKPDNRKAKIVVSIATVSVVVVAIVLVGLYENTQNKTMKASTSSKVISSSPVSSVSDSYKDGTYTATREYYVPHGKEAIKVTVTLKDGMVTDSIIENSENDPESARFQEDFAAEYKSDVIGKKITDVDVPYIAGASDTARGFNDALAQITKQATA